MGDKLLPGEEAVWSVDEWKPGDRAIWLHRERGGYGYVSRIPVEVVSVSATRVRVRAPLAGGRGATKLVTVTPRHLERPRWGE